MRVWQAAEPFVKVFHFLGGAAVCHEIPSMNQDVPVGNFQVSMETVRIAEANDLDAPSFARVIRFGNQ